MRTLRLLGASIQLTGTGIVWDFSNTSQLSFDAGTSTIKLTGTGAILKGGSRIYNNLEILGYGICQVDGHNTFTTFKRNSPTGHMDSELVLLDPVVQTITTKLTLTGDDAKAMSIVHSSDLGTQRFFDLAGAATVELSNVTLQDVAITVNGQPPAQNFTGSNLGDGQNNAGVDFTQPDTLSWVTSGSMWGGSWSDVNHWSSVHGTPRIPLPQDTVIFSSTADPVANPSVNVDMYRMGGTLDFRGMQRSMTLQFGAPERTCYGSIYLSPFVAFLFIGAGAQVFSVRGRLTAVNPSGMYDFDPNGTTIGIPIFIRCPTGTYTLKSTLNGQTLELDAGTFDAGTASINLSTQFKGYGSSQYPRTLKLGSGIWTLSGPGGVWDNLLSDQMMLDKGTATIKMTSTSHKLFAGGSFGYHILQVTPGIEGADLQSLEFDTLLFTSIS